MEDGYWIIETVSFHILFIPLLFQSCYWSGHRTTTFLSLFLKILIILAVLPITAPIEAGCDEESITKVALFNFVVEIACAVEIRRSGCRFYNLRTVSEEFVVRRL